jgi:hypothetical protein
MEATKMEKVTHKYYGKEYTVVIKDQFWGIEGDIDPTMTDIPRTKININNRIKQMKVSLEQLKLNAPKCKVCKKDPTEITEYKYQSPDPITFVLENERMVNKSTFYCTSCYIKAGMPKF